MADSGVPRKAPEEEEIRRRLRNFALRLTGDTHQSEDVAQETLARALVPGTPRDLPYLFSIALNLVRSEARRTARRRPDARPVEQVADARSTDPLSHLVAQEEKAEFWSVVGRIPERERQALVLRVSEGLTCAEVAGALGMTPNAVSCLLHRGKERLRTLLAPGEPEVMTCTEFRDLSELLADGALAAAEARAARDHRAGCAACRSYEEESAVLLAPLHGFPPGPYLPPARPGHLPPWAGGPVLGILLALLLAGGAGAWALQVKGTGGTPATGGTETARAPRTVRPPADPGRPGNPPPSILDDPDGVQLCGRVVTFPGSRPVAGVAIAIDGVPAATTDAGGVFRVLRLAPAGSRVLRMVPTGGPPADILLPELGWGQVHTLADLLVGRSSPAAIRVVRWDARPAAGVRVRACRLAPTAHPDTLPNWRGGSAERVLPAMASALTDADGAVEFPDLAPGTWSFQAEREGVPFSLPVDLEVRDDPDLAATLFLDPATAFEGRVLEDATGAPVPGALVRWSRIGMRGPSYDVRRFGGTSTDAEGRFRFPAAPAVPLLLEVLRPGAPCPSGCLAVDASRIDRADLRLPPAGVLAGTCVEAGTGLPAAGAIVRISVQAGDGMVHSVDSFPVRVGPDGRFEARGIPETARLKAELQPWASWCDPGPFSWNVLRTGTPVRIEAHRTAAIEGRVLDAEGRPAPGRPVIALEVLRRGEGMPGMAIQVARSFADAEGRFRLENLPPGRAFLLSPDPEDISSFRILEEAREALDSADPPPGVVAIPPPAGPGPILRARGLEPLGGGLRAEGKVIRIRGRVLDLAGAPAPGTSLRVLRGDHSPLLKQRESSPLVWIPVGQPVPVAADGSFESEAPAADALTLVATSPRHPPSMAVVRAGKGAGVDGVLLTIEEGRAIAGRVLHDDGTPAAGALLEAMPQADARPTGSLVMVRARTAEDGTFRMDGLYRGPHTLTVGRGPGPVHTVPGAVPGGDPVEIRLPRGDGTRPETPALHPPWKEATDAERTATLGGRVLGAAGRSVSVLAFDPFAPAQRSDAAVVDEAGRFSCRVPPWRRLSLAACADDGRWAYADDLPSGSTDAVLRFEGPATGLLRGRVVTPAGTAAAGVPVHAVRLRGEKEADLPSEVILDGREWLAAGIPGSSVPRLVRATLTGSDGSFDLGSPPGRWAVFAGLPGTEEAASAASVPWSSADPRALELVLVPGRILRVAAEGDDAPPDFAAVRLEGFLPGSSGPVLAVRLPRPAGGLFEFRGLPPGRVTVLLLDGRRQEVGRAAAEPGDPRDPPVKIAVKR